MPFKVIRIKKQHYCSSLLRYSASKSPVQKRVKDHHGSTNWRVYSKIECTDKRPFLWNTVKE